MEFTKGRWCTKGQKLKRSEWEGRGKVGRKEALSSKNVKGKLEVEWKVEKRLSKTKVFGHMEEEGAQKGEV